MEKQSRLEQLNINLDAIPDGKIKEAILVSSQKSKVNKKNNFDNKR